MGRVSQKSEFVVDPFTPRTEQDIHADPKISIRTTPTDAEESTKMNERRGNRVYHMSEMMES